MATAHELLHREQRFAVNDYDGEEPGVVVIDRRSPLLVVAPHAVNHHDRFGAPKLADIMTGGLACTLADALGASVIAASRRVPHWTDWNSRTDPFGRALESIVQPDKVTLVIDVHGMLDHHGVDVCVGLGPHPGRSERLFGDQLMSAMGDLRVTRDRPFSARGPRTVTARAQSKGIPAVQIEIARRFRDPVLQPEAAAHVLAGLVEMLRRYS